MIELLIILALCTLGLAALRRLAAGVVLLLRGLLRLGGAALMVAAIWAVLQLLA